MMEDVRLSTLDHAGRIGFGAVAKLGEAQLIEVYGPTRTSLRNELTLLRREVPWAPIILIRNFDAAELLTLAMIAAEAGARAVLPNMPSEPVDVITRLNDIRELPMQFTRWLAVQRPDLSQSVYNRIEILVRAGTNLSDMLQAEAECGVRQRSLEDTFKRHRLAPPSKFIQFARLMKAVAVLKNPSCQLEAAAHMAGYSSANALHRAVCASLRVDMRQLTRWLGFEWAAYKMCLAFRVDTPARNAASPRI